MTENQIERLIQAIEWLGDSVETIALRMIAISSTLEEINEKMDNIE